MFLYWTENICYSVCGAVYGWMLCDCCSVPFCTPQTQSTMILLFPKLKMYPTGRTKNHRTAGLTTLSGCKETTYIVVT
jgi:hypothetical protein